MWIKKRAVMNDVDAFKERFWCINANLSKRMKTQDKGHTMSTVDVKTTVHSAQGGAGAKATQKEQASSAGQLFALALQGATRAVENPSLDVARELTVEKKDAPLPAEKPRAPEKPRDTKETRRDDAARTEQKDTDKPAKEAREGDDAPENVAVAENTAPQQNTMPVADTNDGTPVAAAASAESATAVPADGKGAAATDAPATPVSTGQVAAQNTSTPAANTPSVEPGQSAQALQAQASQTQADVATAQAPKAAADAVPQGQTPQGGAQNAQQQASAAVATAQGQQQAQAAQNAAQKKADMPADMKVTVDKAATGGTQPASTLPQNTVVTEQNGMASGGQTQQQAFAGQNGQAQSTGAQVTVANGGQTPGEMAQKTASKANGGEGGQAQTAQSGASGGSTTGAADVATQQSAAQQASMRPATQPTPQAAGQSAAGGLPAGAAASNGATSSSMPQVGAGQSAQQPLPGDNAQAAKETARPQHNQAQQQARPVDQVSVQITKAVQQGVDRIRMQLNPAELGRIEVRMEINKDGAMRAVISADNKETLDMLQKDARTLERALQDAGLKTDQNALSFSLRGESGERQWARQGQQQGAMGRAPYDAAFENDEDAMAQLDAQRAYLGRARGGVDIKV
jgi:hypothetical protein